VTIKEWICEMGRALKMLLGVINGLFEAIVELAWWLFAAGLWISIFTLPIVVIFLVLAYTGILKGVDTETAPLNLTNIITIVILSSLSCYYIFRLRKQTVNTSFKFIFLCVFYYAGSAIEGTQYRHYAEHIQAGITQVHIIDSQTKEPLTSYSFQGSSVSSSSKNYLKTKYSSSSSNKNLEFLVYGIEPITVEIGSDGYESKTILLDPQKRYDDITLEMQKVEHAR